MSVYYEPEGLDLTVVDTVELDGESYQFNIIGVWRHKDGRLFTASDSGCSCPSPFEDYTTLESLEEIKIRQQVDQALVKVEGSNASRDEKDAFAEKLTAAWKSRQRQVRRQAVAE